MVTYCKETCRDPPNEIWAKTGSNVTPRIPVNEKGTLLPGARGEHSSQLITFNGARRSGQRFSTMLCSQGYWPFVVTLLMKNLHL